MIQGLVDAAVRRVRAELAAVLEGAESRVLAGPAPEPSAEGLPRLHLSAGALEARRTAREPRAGEPRPQPAAERLEARGDTPLPLAHVPLDGTARGRLVLAEGTVAERRIPLAEGKDFRVDPDPPTVSLLVDVGALARAHRDDVARQIFARVGRELDLASPAELSAVLFDELGLPPPERSNASGEYDTTDQVLAERAALHPAVPLILAWRALAEPPSAALLLDYSFAGIFTVREFEQALLVDAFATDAAAAERWGSLAAGVLLGYHDELLREGMVEHVSRGGISTLHRPTGIEMAEGAPGAFAAGARLHLVFRVGGQIRLSREPRGGHGVIERIYSHGSGGTGPVAVEVELG